MHVNNVIKMLDEEIMIYYPRPGIKERFKTLELSSYKRWAIEECRNYIISRSNVSPIVATEEFRNMMDEAACNSRDYDQNAMFSIAYDVATDVLDLLIRSE